MVPIPIQTFITFSIVVLTLTGCMNQQQPADLIITGKIYTMDNVQPEVEAVVVRGNRIVFAGFKKNAGEFQGDDTQIIELGQSVMTPGLIEGHAHMLGVGYKERNLDLTNAKSYDEIVARVKEVVSKAKPGDWILGRGWHQDKWEKKPSGMVKGFQTHTLLSEISPKNPVFLTHASGHVAMANAQAMQLAGVNPLSIERGPSLSGDGGEVIMDALGNPTGIFSENAMSLIEKHIPAPNLKSDSTALELAMQAFIKNGITEVHDAGVNKNTIDLYYQFKRSGKLKIRLYVMLENDRQLLKEWYKNGPDIDRDHRLTIRSIKLYGDGALGSRGAWLLSPYEDRPGFHGMATISMDTVLKVAREGLRYGFQVCTHAIGDRANREVLDRYELALKQEGGQFSDHRFRIEHAQHLDPVDIPRFAELGVIPAMQAIHMASDRPWAIDRLGKERIVSGAYVWQSLLKSGARIVNGTDAPVEPINPIASFFASVTRKTLQGNPKDGFEPAERMTREQALRSYTLDAAFAAFQEKDKGSIEVGKLADFTIFSRDIMNIPEDSLLQTEIQMTIIDGKVVYQKK